MGETEDERDETVLGGVLTGFTVIVLEVIYCNVLSTYEVIKPRFSSFYFSLLTLSYIQMIHFVVKDLFTTCVTSA